MDAEGEQEEGEIRPEREKTDGGRTLLHEARQTEEAAPYIKSSTGPARYDDRPEKHNGVHSGNDAGLHH